MSDRCPTPKSRRIKVRARLRGITSRISQRMEIVRQHACSGKTPGGAVAPLWVMDSLHDIRQELYNLYNVIENHRERIDL